MATRFLTHLLQPGEQIRPFTAEELAGFPAKPEDFQGVALIGLENPDPTTRALLPVGLSSEEIFAALKQRDEIRKEPYRPFVTPPSVAEAIGFDIDTGVMKLPMLNYADALGGERQALIALYGLLQFAEAYLHYGNTPALREWLQTGLSQFDRVGLAVMLGYLISEGLNMRNTNFSSDTDIDPTRTTNFQNYATLELTRRVAAAYGKTPGQILFAYSFFPEFQVWEDLNNGVFTTEYGNLSSQGAGGPSAMFPDAFLPSRFG